VDPGLPLALEDYGIPGCLSHFGPDCERRISLAHQSPRQASRRRSPQCLDDALAHLLACRVLPPAPRRSGLGNQSMECTRQRNAAAHGARS